MPNPKKGENSIEWMKRCMEDTESINSFPDSNQRYVVCKSKWHSNNFSNQKISFDYDGVLSTEKGTNLAIELSKTNIVYIISARSNKDKMMNKATLIGIPSSRVYAMGSNKQKIEKVNSLGINKHYDNNPDVILALGIKGKLFK
jgi:hypothetical protein